MTGERGGAMAGERGGAMTGEGEGQCHNNIIEFNMYLS